MPIAPTSETLLRELSRPRLAELARLYGVALPEGTREKQNTHLLNTVDVQFGPLLGRLTRDELRRACRKHELDDSARARTGLADTLLEAFDGDAGNLGLTNLFGMNRIDRKAPKIGDVILLRHRQWLVEDVTPPPEPNQLTLIKAVCLDDDNQGEPIDVLWEMELGARVVQPEIGALGEGVDEPRLFAAYLHALKWNSVTASPSYYHLEIRVFQRPRAASFRAGHTQYLRIRGWG